MAAPPTPPPRRAALATLSPNTAAPSFDVEAMKSPSRRRRGSIADRRKLSQAPAVPVEALQEEKQEVWRGWMCKQSGAKQSGKGRFTVGSVLRKWDQRYFVVRRSGQHTASIEWYRSEDTSLQPQHSFVLTGGALLPANGDSSEHCVLLLPPMERGGKSHRVTLKREGEFTAFAAALTACGVTVHLPGLQLNQSANGHVSGSAMPSVAAREVVEMPEVPQGATQAAVAVDTVAENQKFVQRAQFAQAVATSVRRLQDPLSQSHAIHELHSAVDRLMKAALGAGVVIRSRQVTLVAEPGKKLGLRLESCPSAADFIVQVRDVVDGGLAAATGIGAGMALESINGCSVTGWNIGDIEAAVASTPRPFTLAFTDFFLGYPTSIATNASHDECAGLHQVQAHPSAQGNNGSVEDDDNSSSSDSSSSDDEHGDNDDDDANSSSGEEYACKPVSQPSNKRSIAAAMSTDAHASEPSGLSQRPRRNAMVIGQHPSSGELAGARSLTRRQQLEQQLQLQLQQQRQRVGSQRSFSSALSVSSAGSSSPGPALESTRTRAEELQCRREERQAQRAGSQRSISSALSIASVGSSSPNARLEEPRARVDKLQRRREERRGRIQQAQEMMCAGEAAGLVETTGNEERFEV